jgi:PEGA domain
MRRGYFVLFLGLAFSMANAAKSKPAQEYDLTVKVTKSETAPIAIDNPNAGACDQASYSAYCRHAAVEFVQTRMLVESGDKVFNISCVAQDRWSNCVPLEVGDTAKGHLDKRGLSLLYTGSDGKAHKQLYQVLYSGATLHPSAAGIKETAGSAPQAAGAASAAPESGASVYAANAGAVTERPRKEEPSATNALVVTGTARCSFSSQPSGAEILLDGKYVGNTPSALGLAPGPHRVQISLAGFRPWKRQLEVVPGSEISVAADLSGNRQ